MFNFYLEWKSLKCCSNCYLQQQLSPSEEEDWHSLVSILNVFIIVNFEKKIFFELFDRTIGISIVL